MVREKLLHVLCFGNPFVKGDDAAQKIAGKAREGRLKGMKFVSCGSPEELFAYARKDFVILDVVKGIKKPVVIKDLRELEETKLVSLHDFDLAFFLKLVEKLGLKAGKLGVTIVGIPANAKIGDVKPILLKLRENLG